MKSGLIERLLLSDEGVTLDFKREQYEFESASKEAKGELLKDVLAFANTAREDDAYILIGVEEKRGAASEVVGVSVHLDDAKLQQFVNSKTQLPVTFSYRETMHDGLPIGVLRIPRQPRRPIYANADYGKVKKNHVYVRHGSCTAIASPDEIVQMGARATPPATQTDLDNASRELDDHQAFVKAPGSGKLAGKLIVKCQDTERAERVLEIFRSAPDKRDEVYVDVAWAELLMAMKDGRHIDAMGDIGTQIVKGVYSYESEREAQRWLFPNGLPPNLDGQGSTKERSSRRQPTTEAVGRLNALQKPLPRHIDRVGRGEATTTSALVDLSERITASEAARRCSDDADERQAWLDRLTASYTFGLDPIDAATVQTVDQWLTIVHGVCRALDDPLPPFFGRAFDSIPVTVTEITERRE